LLERGYYGAMAELSRRGRHDEVKTLRNEDRIVNEHGAQVWPFRPGWLTHTARRLDVATYRVFGVVTTASMFDTRPTEKVHRPDLAALADAEYIDGARRDTLGVAGWLQLIGRFGGAVVPTPR